MRRAAIFVIIGFALAAYATAQDRPIPLASELDTALAPLAIARDGTAITIRASADNALKVCVEPAVGHFGPTRCFVVGDIRAGRVK